MLKRIVTGVIYMIVLVGFFLLKIYVDKIFFDILLLFFAAVGTFEMLRAFGNKIPQSQKIVTMISSVLIICAYVISDLLYRSLGTDGKNDINYAVHISFIVFIAAVSSLFLFTIFKPEEATIPSTGNAVLCLLYPTAFILVLIACNHMPSVAFSQMALLFVFGVCPIADTFAFCFGKLLGKRFPLKLAPKVSPNKTVIGGIGGLIGGALGGALIYLCYALLEIVPLSGMEFLFFASLGFLSAVFAVWGDLVESAIKRSLGIKDMGKLLPGHGGILDRIDSALFAGLIVCLIFVVRLIVTGN